MPKTIPLRQCMGCREQKPKNTLMRVVRTPEGEVVLDFRGKTPGRGAYVCRSADCLRRALKSRALDRALELTVPEELIDRLREETEVRDG